MLTPETVEQQDRELEQTEQELLAKLEAVRRMRSAHQQFLAAARGEVAPVATPRRRGQLIVLLQKVVTKPMPVAEVMNKLLAEGYQPTNPADRKQFANTVRSMLKGREDLFKHSKRNQTWEPKHATK